MGMYKAELERQASAVIEQAGDGDVKDAVQFDIGREDDEGMEEYDDVNKFCFNV